VVAVLINSQHYCQTAINKRFGYGFMFFVLFTFTFS